MAERRLQRIARVVAVLFTTYTIAAAAAVRQRNVGRGQSDVALGPGRIERDAGLGIRDGRSRLRRSPQLEPTRYRVGQEQLALEERVILSVIRIR